MNVELPADQRAFIDRLVATGRFPSADDAIREAVHLLTTRERLKQEIDKGVEQANRNEVFDHDSVFAHLRETAMAAENLDRTQ